MRIALLLSLIVAPSAMGDLVIVRSPGVSGNADTRTGFFSSAGIAAAEFSETFEGFAVGTNLNGVSGVLPGGLTVSSPSAVTVQSNSSFFGTSLPIGTRALALRETSVLLTFATPVEFFAGFVIDKPTNTVVVTLEGGAGTREFSLGGTTSSGASALFFGVWRNDLPRMISIEFRSFGSGDDEWGLDNLEYGVVPGPGAVAAAIAGALMVARRRRR